MTRIPPAALDDDDDKEKKDNEGMKPEQPMAPVQMAARAVRLYAAVPSRWLKSDSAPTTPPATAPAAASRTPPPNSTHQVAEPIARLSAARSGPTPCGCSRVVRRFARAAAPAPFHGSPN